MIYLLRHGLDDENFIGGWSNVDLTDEGIKEVEDVGKYLKNNNYKFDRIISSDVKRAQTTSQIINKYLNLKIYYSPLLRELNKGDFNGIDKKLLPDIYKNIDIYKKYPNGESMIEFYNRIKRDLDKIMIDNSLIITHRGVINMIYYILNNKDIDMNKEQFGVTHASLHVCDYKAKVIRKER